MIGLVVDLFAGGGGASEGLAQALGRDPDIAINHDAEALAMHKVNHPGTRHMLNDITRVLPLEATGGQSVAILHASPDCTHFSKAKGAKPRSQFIRDLAWTVVRWAEDTRPRLITLENVEEFMTWGPLDLNGYPIKEHAGDTFRAWVKRLKRLGYKISWRLLRACDYGAPTTRRRLFVVARLDGKSPSWPKPTHGAPNSPAVLSGKLLPWRTAAECIDWNIQSQSIFDRKKPLAINTQRRIAEGIRRYVLGSTEPFIVCCNHSGDFRGQSIADPLATVTQKLGFGVVSPVISGCVINPNHVAKNYTPFRGHDIQEPLRSITKSPGFALATAHAAACVAKHYGGVVGHGMRQPLGTVTTVDHHSLVTANMIKMRGLNVGSPADEPLRTISAQGQHHALVTACINKHFGSSIGQDIHDPLHTVVGKAKHSLTSCLIKYYGTALAARLSDPMHTLTAKARMGLVSAETDTTPGRYEQVRSWLRDWGVIGPDEEAEITHAGIVYRLTDICMRMLAPRELYTAQGFGPHYKISPDINGKPLSKTAQVRMCGNSVPPQFVAALVRANGPQTWAEEKQPDMPLFKACAVAV